jgi:hypothetical protein
MNSNAEAIDKIINTVLYEGYMLYPYRRSALKNKHRWNFGLVYPAGIEPCRMSIECLVQAAAEPSIDVEVRFLQVYEQNSWQEAVERRIRLDQTLTRRLPLGFALPGSRIAAPPSPGGPGGRGSAFDFDGLCGEVVVQIQQIEPALCKLTVNITNNTPRGSNSDDILRCLVSTHTILWVQNGAFVSLIDPPAEFKQAAEGCRNRGAWPVLVGKEPARDCMLASPIILYDYPQVADESHGELFDATEIDEILILRILTLTDAEKDEMRRSGERERGILERVEALKPEQLLRLHGILRRNPDAIKPGDRVRIKPKTGGDAMDVVLSGRAGIVESVEHDYDNRTHVAVVIEDDPGMDLGLARATAHRFFFSADELERIA